MKKLIFVLVTIVTLVSLSLATTWESEFKDFRVDTADISAVGNFTGDNHIANGMHGVVVDPAGKVWVSFYNINKKGTPNSEGDVELLNAAGDT